MEPATARRARKRVMIGVVPDGPAAGVADSLGQSHKTSPERSEFCDDGVHVVDESEDKGDEDDEGNDPVAERIQDNYGRDGNGEQQDEPGACFSYVSLIH